MDDDAINKLLDEHAPTGATTATADEPSFGPQAFAVQQGLRPIAPQPRGPSIAGRTTPSMAESTFRAENEVPGVPLDTESGASTWERLMTEYRDNQANQAKYFENKYGKDTVRRSREGELIVRVPDPKNPGKSKDMTVHPHGGMSASDFLDLSMQVPEIALWIAAEKMGGKALKIPETGLLGRAARLGLGAAGAETGGAVLKDIPADIYDTGKIDFPEIAKRRGAAALGDVTVGGVVEGGKGVARFLRAPLHGFRGQKELDALGAQEHFKNKFGEYVPLSMGESTGIPLFGRGESYVEKEPGGSGPLRKLKAEQETGLRRLQALLMGDPPLDEETGAKAIEEIQGKTFPILQSEEARREALSGTAQSRIEDIISGQSSPNKELETAKLGSDIRASVIGKRDAEKAESDRLYDEVKKIPGGEGKIFPGQDLQKSFEGIRKSLPSPEQLIKTPTGLIDQFGNPITQDVKSVKVSRPFVPDNILARLDEVIGLKDPKFSLSDLKQMRREVYDDIGRGEGVPGLGIHYLNDIGKALTGFINSSIDSLPKGDLKAALQAADKHYKDKLIPFNRVGLTEMFRGVDEAGGIADNQIVNRTLGGTDAYRNWQLLKDVLGPNSGEFTRMKRAVADNLLENSRLPGEESIDAKSFITNLYKMRLPTSGIREIAVDVFGNKANELFRQARFLQYAQGDKINVEELKKLLAQPNPTGTQLKALIDAERKRDDLYKNQIIKAIGDGKIDESTLHPSEFVNRLLEGNKIGLKETKQVMDLLSGKPELQQELRQKVFEKIFRDSARSAQADDINRVVAGDKTHILSGKAMVQALKDPTYAKKIETILGPESYNDLAQYIKLTAPMESKEEFYGMAGSMAYGTRIGQLERVLERPGGILKFAGNTFRSFVFSWILADPAARAYLGRVPGSLIASRMPADVKQMAEFTTSLLLNPKFIQAVAKEFPGATGARFISHIRQSIDQSVRQSQNTQTFEGKGPPGFIPGTDEEKAKFWNQQLNAVGPPTNAPRGTMIPQGQGQLLRGRWRHNPKTGKLEPVQ